MIDASHKGPIISYLAKVPDATQTTVTGLQWFKIAEAGFNAAKGTWAVDDLIAAGGKWNIKIPACIAPGQYLLRHELIALHSAGSYPGAQFYVSLFGSLSFCRRLIILERSWSVLNSTLLVEEALLPRLLASLVLMLVGVSSQIWAFLILKRILILLGSDPGITISIYYPVVTSYDIPGKYRRCPPRLNPLNCLC